MVRLSRKALSDLYEAPLPELQAASSFVRQSLNGDRIWYNRNFHIEPSNICAHRCRFCSYRRDDASQPGAWSMALDDILPYCEAKFEPGMTEIHIVGSVHPGQSFDYYRQIVALAKGFARTHETPEKPIAIKAYTAVEIDGSGETPGIGSVAVEKLPDAIVEANTYEVDGVAGATLTSTAIRNAVAAALEEAAA